MTREFIPSNIETMPSSVGPLAGCAGRACVNCGGTLASPPSAAAPLSLCGDCLLAWALEPCPLPAATTGGELPEGIGSTWALGNYVLVEEIGRGGMGVIYRALHRETNEAVALKTVLPQYETCPETLARFRREAEAAQSLDHPHSMPIFEVGSSDRDVPFFTMPLAAGGGLHQLGAKYHRRWRQTAELMEKIAGAIHHAHSHGVLHRDIKPGNILFTEDHEPLVTDFGLAKPLTGSDDLTRSCAVLGTPNYVAPEQAAGRTRELTPAADIYGLGAVFFELLTGRPPFVGDNPLQVLQLVSEKAPIAPRRLVPTVPRILERICLRCLEHHPQDRYATARELADDLHRWLEGREISVRPGHAAWRRTLRTLRAARWWWLAAAGTVLVFFALWMLCARGASGPQAITVTIVIDDLGQEQPSALAAQTRESLLQALSRGRSYRPQKTGTDPAGRTIQTVDPLTYGRSVNVQMVLAGCLRQTAGRTRLVTRLLRCDTGETVWYHTDDAPLNPTGAELATLAGSVVRDLPTADAKAAAHEVRAKPNISAEAQTFYTRAMELAARANRPDLEAATALYARAFEMDPRFAAARAMHAFALWTLADSYGQSERLPFALAAARDALAVDPHSAQAHRVIASCLLKQVRLPEALDEFWSAVELNPQSAGCCQSLGICLRRIGHPEQAVRWLRRAVQLEPARGALNGSLGEALVLCGLDEQAETTMQRAVELDADKPDVQVALGALRTWQGRFEEARRLCSQARRRFPDHGRALNLAAWIDLCDHRHREAEASFLKLRGENSYLNDWTFYGAINPASALAYLADEEGLHEKAAALAEEALALDFAMLEEHPHNCRVLHDVAATYSVLGDGSQALRYLQEAISAGWAEHRSSEIDPRFAHVRASAQFKTLLADTRPVYHGERLP